MPIYEYACGSCEHRFETIQRASEEPLKDCPACGASALKKLLSAPVFRLKGAGWYETDFKTGNKKNISGSDESNGKANGQDKGDGAGKTGSSEEGKAGDSASKGSSTEKTATTAGA
ncbi:MAG: zinc ribbon domain-containing protein [Gammaproteobacteria bacterium]|nr:zinc ribbon domain-containing protein [Gammaproteobacteria bacterium]